MLTLSGVAPWLGCPSKLVSIRNNRNWNRNKFRHYPEQNVCFASIPKLRVSMFRLNQNKQKTNRNSLIGSIFCYFLHKIQGFSGFFRFFSFFSFFFGLFQNILFRCFDWTETNRRPTQNSSKESIFGYFSKNSGLFRFVSVCYETDLFVSVVLIQVRNTDTNWIFKFLVSRNKPKQTRNRSCFGLFRFKPKFLFVCFEGTLTLATFFLMAVGLIQQTKESDIGWKRWFWWRHCVARELSQWETTTSNYPPSLHM